MKYPLILWSGGLDSTFLVWDRLRNNHPIDVLYINLKNNIENNKHELKTIKKLKLILKQAGYASKIRKQFNYTIPIKRKSTVICPQVAGWNDAVLWIYDKKIHSDIEIAYVRKDDFWHFRDKVEKYQKLQFDIHHNITNNIITYPLEWFSKAMIIKEMKKDPIGKILLQNIRYCSEAKTVICHICPSCISHAAALQEIKTEKKYKI